MEINQIIALSTSGLISVTGIIFTESIKEIIKKYFALKTKKQVTKLYWVLLIIAIVIPLGFAYFDSETKSKPEIMDRNNKIEPMK